MYHRTLISLRLRLLALMFMLAIVVGLFAHSRPARALDLSLDGNMILSCGTATASGGAATLNNKCGVITSEALTTAPGSPYTLTLTNSVIAATDLIFFAVENGTNTGGDLMPLRATAGSGSATILARNGAYTGTGQGTGTSVSAFNGTIKIRYWVVKP